MGGEKFIAMSRTVWGVVVTIVGVLAGSFGWDWWGLISQDVEAIFNMVVSIVGSAITIWGRLSAKTTLTVLPPKPPA